MDFKIIILMAVLFLTCLCVGVDESSKPSTTKQEESYLTYTSTTGSVWDTVTSETTLEDVKDTTPEEEKNKPCDRCSDGTPCDMSNQEGYICICSYPLADGLYETCVLEKPLPM